VFNSQGYVGPAGEACRLNQPIIAYSRYLSIATYKWFGYCGITAGKAETRNVKVEIGKAERVKRDSGARKWTKSQRPQVQNRHPGHPAILKRCGTQSVFETRVFGEISFAANVAAGEIVR
jgi:hypothetical protein